MEQNYKIRRRVNFSVSVKGIVTPDITTEMIDGTQEEIMKESSELLEKAMVVARNKSAGMNFEIK